MHVPAPDARLLFCPHQPRCLRNASSSPSVLTTISSLLTSLPILPMPVPTRGSSSCLHRASLDLLPSDRLARPRTCTRIQVSIGSSSASSSYPVPIPLCLNRARDGDGAAVREVRRVGCSHGWRGRWRGGSLTKFDQRGTTYSEMGTQIPYYCRYT